MYPSEFATFKLAFNCRLEQTIFVQSEINKMNSFLVTFFSATIDDRNLIFGQKLHIGTPYRGKRFGPIRFLLPVCRLLIFIIKINSRQTGSRNLMGPKRFPRYGVPIWSLWPNIGSLLSIVAEKNECPFLVTFFSATIDDRNLIFGQKLHIGTPYRGKRFWTQAFDQISDFCHQ
jgi:hypothetical protein